MGIFWYAFMWRAVVAGALIGGACGVVGVYVVLRGLSFIGAGIAHAAFGGVAIGVLLGLPPYLTAGLFSLAVALGIGYTSRRGVVREDVAVGILFSASMALGIFLLGFIPGYTVDLFGYLFGSIIAVGPEELWTTLGLALVVFVLVGLFQKEFLAISFDPEMAQVAGLSVGVFHNLLLCLMALTVVLSLRVVGVVLVAALLVAPAATAYQLTQDFRRMMAYSAAFGVGEAVGGLILSFYANTAPGATIVLLATAVFGVALALSPRRRKSART